MPVYILHGFRWPRAGFGGIRVHIIIHDLEDCSAEYIQNPHSHAELSKSFRNLYPEIMKQLDPPPFGGGKGIHFLEQYDPEDVTGENVVSQPYAFVSDRVVTIAGGGPGFSDRIGLDGSMVTTTLTGASGLGTPTSVKGAGKGSVSAEIATNAAAKFQQQTLSLSVEEVVAEGPGLTTAASEAFANLRDEIAPGEKIGWWVVYNGDPERACDSEDDDEEEEEEEAEDDYDDDDDDDDVEAEDYEQEGGDIIVAKEAEKQKSSQQPQPSHPTFPLVQRTRPSQPPPKPRIFEQKDPNLTASDYTTIPTINPAPPPPPPSSPSSPLRSPPIKGVGKRLPGMKAAAPQPQPNQQQQQQQQQQPMPQATKPKVVPKPESLKKKLFGKRG